MWIVLSREYNEDPVLKTMLPAEWLNARRRTVLLFYRDPASGRVDRLAVARYNVGKSIAAAWDMQKFPDQWQALVALIAQRKPNKIALDTSRHFGHADGIDHTDYTELLAALPAEYRTRVVSAEPLAVRWLETRTAREMQIYPQLIDATHKIIAEGFSERVITPGITITADVVWWFRQKIRDLGYDTWFHPSVEIQRPSQSAALADAEGLNPTIYTHPIGYHGHAAGLRGAAAHHAGGGCLLRPGRRALHRRPPEGAASGAAPRAQHRAVNVSPCA